MFLNLDLKHEMSLRLYQVHVGLADWIKQPLMMLEVRGSNRTSLRLRISLLYLEALETPQGAGRTS